MQNNRPEFGSRGEVWKNMSGAAVGGTPGEQVISLYPQAWDETKQLRMELGPQVSSGMDGGGGAPDGPPGF